MRSSGAQFSGASALIMGLGLHGGGLESAIFLAKRGARLTVTDLRGKETLAPSIRALDEKLESLGAPRARYVLGGHESADFAAADLVIKNPGVRPDSPYLKAARRIETDISLFLRENPSRLCAVTGSKGKSFTASALRFTLAAHHGARGGEAYLGGNITVSPLAFLEKLRAEDDVVLELSSWQLGDLPADLLKPRVALITALMSDHLDRYGDMESYLADKKLIYRNQDAADITIAGEDAWSAAFLAETPARTARYGAAPPPLAGGWLERETGTAFARGPLGRLSCGETIPLMGKELKTPGEHQKINLLAASLALLDLGVDAECITREAARFPGIEHRLELFAEKDGVRWYNDTAATIPEAAAAAIYALGAPVLVAGGTDKGLDFSPLVKAAARAKKIILLAGTASEKLLPLFTAARLAYDGPFDRLDEAVSRAFECAAAGDRVVLSPGCASFGMFLHEFDRGKKWKAAVRSRLSLEGGAD
jgi:UDP-N-acetylmuramoylalanine--D-glutamate ligase